MELQKFINRITEELKEYYGDKTRVETHRICKNNGILLYGVSVLPEKLNIAPTIYLNGFYNDFRKGREYEEIFQHIIQVINQNQLQEGFDVEFFMNYERLKKHLVFRIINKERNLELLEKVPYKELQDLAVVCHCLIETEQIGTGSILIYHHHLNTWQVSPEQLFMDAAKNSPIVEPWKLHKMSTLVKEILSNTIEGENRAMCDDSWRKQKDISEGALDDMIKEMEDVHLPMYVLTNTRRYYGAASIIYQDVMEYIANFFDNDYYILPSSVHELILLSKSDDMDPSVLNEMIRDVNESQVEEEEWLSDHAYLYHRKEGFLQMV